MTVPVPEGRRSLWLLMGFFGMALFAAGDVLLQSFPAGGERLLFMLSTAVTEMPLGRLYFTLLTGMLAAPLMWAGLRAMDARLRDLLDGCHGRLYGCFHIGAVIASLSFFAAHSVCAALVMAARQALVCGLSPEALEAAYAAPFLLCFAVTNVWVTVAQLMLSVPFIVLTWKGALGLPRAAVLMNTIGTMIVFRLLGALLSRATGSELFALLAASGPSLGMGLMFLAMRKGVRPQ